ncbi:glycosyltransferase [Spiroplasma endosymbiont of Polydrusus pterygomalis]|uniref:glycosyltransferase n=1 Tax=Spiroplasma endosymbiont of Polydrusus pterygomalis TaxID=3139327 RepID=UPI003CCB4D10
MLLSFVLYTTSFESKSLDFFLTKIFVNKKSNFEVIVVDDGINNENLEVLSKYFKLYPQNLKIITNYQVTGIAISRNLGLKYTAGTHVVILNPTEIPSPDFVEKVTKILHNNKELDCIEYCVRYEFDKNNVFQSAIRTEANNLYNLNTTQGKVVFALTTPVLTTKIMKVSIINEYNLQFRKEIQFDSLFLYSFLAHCKTYYAINETLIKSKSNTLENDNIFELMHQWIHILNYYNNYKIRKVLYEELEYAFVRYYLYTLLRFISISKKPALIEKTYNRVKEIIEFKFKNFKRNSYFNTINPNDKFTTYALDLSAYFKKYFKDNNIKDDSKYWE